MNCYLMAYISKFIIAPSISIDKCVFIKYYEDMNRKNFEFKIHHASFDYNVMIDDYNDWGYPLRYIIYKHTIDLYSDEIPLHEERIFALSNITEHNQNGYICSIRNNISREEFYRATEYNAYKKYKPSIEAICQKRIIASKKIKK